MGTLLALSSQALHHNRLHTQSANHTNAHLASHVPAAAPAAPAHHPSCCAQPSARSAGRAKTAHKAGGSYGKGRSERLAAAPGALRSTVIMGGSTASSQALQDKQEHEQYDEQGDDFLPQEGDTHVSGHSIASR
eukprot:scaffold82305_cov22-Tisochrysis_lutea.AAC.2